MKLTTKLLLGATVVAGLSVSAFAACAADVYMGNKQLKNVANGVDDGDAVNVGQLNQASVLGVFKNSYTLTCDATIQTMPLATANVQRRLFFKGASHARYIVPVYGSAKRMPTIILGYDYGGMNADINLSTYSPPPAEGIAFNLSTNQYKCNNNASYTLDVYENN